MKKLRGEITVFLTLILTILISLLFTAVEAARINAVQFQTECVADMALQSALAEYNRELLEQYDLFFIETGYGTKESGYILLEEHIREYMRKNFETNQGMWGYPIKDLLNISPESVVVLEATGAMDGDGEVLERKAVEYMLQRYGFTELSDILADTKTVQENGLLEDTMEEKRQQNEAAIDGVDTRVKDDKGKKKRIPVNNPADGVNARRGSAGILKIVTGGATISDVEVCQSDYVSYRGYEEKDGFLMGELGVGRTEDLLFQKYLMEKCGNYTKKKEDSLLAYQMEYILAGKASDYENLNAVVNSLLVLRETANFMYIMSDSGKQAEAEALALTLAAVILFPELKDLIKLSILIAWSYAESVNDIQTLLSGGRVPIWKTTESWNLSLKNALKMKTSPSSQISEEGNAVNGERGLDYQGYLHILLAIMNQTYRNLRFMDLIEMDIRKTSGNESFQIDHCIHAFTAEVITISGKGHSCFIKRTVGYQK